MKRQRGQHFLLSAKSVDLDLFDVMSMTDDQVTDLFRRLRWPKTNGQPVCPHCGGLEHWFITTRKYWKCAGCRKTFSLTSGTLFHSRKKSLRFYLAGLFAVAAGAKGRAALELRRLFRQSYKAAFVWLHKVRKCIAKARKGLQLAGEVEIDALHVGGHVRPPNAGRQGQKGLPKALPATRQVILGLTARQGGTVPILVESENEAAALAAVVKHVQTGSTVIADEAQAYNRILTRYPMMRVNHSHQYSDKNGAYTNNIESFFDRVRRAEIGIYHHISGPYVERYTHELALRSDQRRVSTGANFHELVRMTIQSPQEHGWLGYWGKRVPGQEELGWG